MRRRNPIPHHALYYGHKLHCDQNEKLSMYGCTFHHAQEKRRLYILVFKVRTGISVDFELDQVVNFECLKSLSSEQALWAVHCLSVGGFRKRRHW